MAREDDHVLIPAGLKAGANRRRRGEDVRAGQTVLGPGCACGRSTSAWRPSSASPSCRSRRRLEVAVFSTGDEIVAPGRPLPEGGVYDANRFILIGLLRRLPVRVRDLGVLPDDPGAVRTALEAAAEAHHLVLTSGGASRGDEDHVVRSVAALGRLDFWQIAMKPGRPLGLGRIGRSLFVALPGNPVATLVCFLLFARPVLLRLAGATWTEPRRVPLPAGFRLRKPAGRAEYLRGRPRDRAGRPPARPPDRARGLGHPDLDQRGRRPDRGRGGQDRGPRGRPGAVPELRRDWGWRPEAHMPQTRRVAGEALPRGVGDRFRL